MGVDALIFDCDGVLIDSEILVCRIAAEELTRLGYAITTEQVVTRFAGRRDGEMQAEIEGEWGRPVPLAFSERVRERTIEAYGKELKIVPGVIEALDRIRIPVCVASSSYPAKLKLGLEAVGLYDRFMPNVVSGAMVAHGKPAPDVFLFAAGWMRTSPSRCLVVEDSVAGVSAGVAAGMTVLGFTGGSHGGAGLSGLLMNAGAVTTFARMVDLPELV